MLWNYIEVCSWGYHKQQIVMGSGDDAEQASTSVCEWHLANVFSLVYFSVVVCLRGLYHHILLATARALCQGRCTPHARFPLTKGGGLISGSTLLGRTGGVVELVLGSVFIIELDTGLAGIYFHRYYTEYDVCHKQNT